MQNFFAILAAFAYIVDVVRVSHTQSAGDFFFLDYFEAKGSGLSLFLLLIGADYAHT